MKVLICGDRNWSNETPMRAFISCLPQGTIIIEGEAKGADLMARRLGLEYGHTIDPHPALWSLHGRAAGPIRNAQMLAAKPDVVVAFHEDITRSKGTANMVKQARKAGVPVMVVCA